MFEMTAEKNKPTLTSLDGDPVGTSVGFRGDLEGTLVGGNVSIRSSVGSAVGFRGDWLGLDVG